MYDLFSTRLLVGAIVILIGMMGNVFIDWKEKQPVVRP
jgi:hypothetical protein